MSVVELKYPAVRESFDLGTYDEGLKGQTLSVLMNPSQRFRREFTSVRGEAFVEYIAFICGWDVDEAKANIEDMQPDVLTWLFVGVWDAETNELIMPHVTKLWEAYAERRVKGWGRPSAKPNATMANLPEAEAQAEAEAASQVAPASPSPSPHISLNGSGDANDRSSATESMTTFEPA